MAIVHALLQTFMFLGDGNVVHLDRIFSLRSPELGANISGKGFVSLPFGVFRSGKDASTALEKR